MILLNRVLTDPQIVKRHESRGELAVEEVVRHVDRAHTRVRVVVRVHAEAERSGAPERRGAPVIVVVLEAVHLLRQALLLQLGLLPELSLFLPQSLFLQSPSLLPRDLFLVFLRVGLAVALVSRFQRSVLHGRQSAVVTVRVHTCEIESHAIKSLALWSSLEREEPNHIRIDGRKEESRLFRSARTLLVPPTGSLENRDVYPGRSENPRCSVLLHLAVLPQRLRGRRRRHRCRADGRISRSIGTRGFATGHRTGPRCIHRMRRAHGDARLIGNCRFRAAIRVLEIVATAGRIGDCLPRGGRPRGRRHHDGRETALAVVVPGVLRRRRRRRRRRRFAGAVDAGHVHLGRVRRHVVVHAVRQQGVVTPMMMRLPASLRPVLLGLRSVRGRFLRLLSARRFLRPSRRRDGDRRGRSLGDAGPDGVRGDGAVFIEPRRRDLLVNRAHTGLRCGGFRGRDTLRVNVRGLVVFLVVATRVTSLRGMVVRSVRAARFIRFGEFLLVVRHELRSLLQQVSANLL